MSSGLFSIARTALLTHQGVLETISHNIANSETPGYSRQEAMVHATTPNRMPYGSIGTGVTITSVVRRRDIMLDDGFRSANGLTGQSEMRRDLLTQLQDVFGEPSDAGMSSAMDNFFDAWSDLATSPSSGAAKAVVQQRGRQLAQLFNDYNTQLSMQSRSAQDRMTNTVQEVNLLAKQVADLNARIVGSQNGGNPANDLSDERDLLLDRLSQLTGARVFQENNGSASVIVGNSTLVFGDSSRPLTMAYTVPNPPPAVTPPDLPIEIHLGDSSQPLLLIGGELGSLRTFINSDVPNLRSRLDALASSIAAEVNAEHTQNFVFNGNTIPGSAAADFFNPGTNADPVTAGNMRLSDAVAVDANQITTSRNANAPLDNAGALAVSSIRDVLDKVTYTSPSGVVETSSFLGFFRTTVTRLGLDARSADDDAGVYRTLSDQADRRRQAVSGVNTDEELVKMLRVQQAYAAATKLIKAADEMLQTVLSLV